MQPYNDVEYCRLVCPPGWQMTACKEFVQVFSLSLPLSVPPLNFCSCGCLRYWKHGRQQTDNDELEPKYTGGDQCARTLDMQVVNPLFEMRV